MPIPGMHVDAHTLSTKKIESAMSERSAAKERSWSFIQTNLT
jgi:hypothetical protein